MSTTKQSERVSARIPPQVYDKLIHAAQITGTTLNQFLVQSAIEKADKLLLQESTIHMTQQDAQVFFDTIESPPPINKKLMNAIKQYQEVFPNAENRGTQ